MYLDAGIPVQFSVDEIIRLIDNEICHSVFTGGIGFLQMFFFNAFISCIGHPNYICVCIKTDSN